MTADYILAKPRPEGTPFSIVTGAAQGIGRGIAERLVADGHRVFLIDILESVSETASTIGAQGFARIDITDIPLLQKTIRSAAEDAGRLDTLVNCAGTAGRESFEEMSLKTWTRDVETNMTAMAFACQAAVFPQMKSQGFGRLINIASVSGKVGGVGPVDPYGAGGRSGAGYASSKAGAINLTRWIARQTGVWGITANAVCPGPIETPMTEGASYPVEEMPVPQMGKPRDIAAAVSFLAGDETDFITGACLHVDGGMVRA